jgi:hypothetical protein
VRLAARTDDNHAEIVLELMAHGCDVLSLAAVGNGCPDLLAWSQWAGHQLLEVKDGRKPPSARKLTPAQVKFHGRWKGPVHVVTCPAEALAAMGIRIEPADQR